ncbi:MAG: transpeptidase family protein [Acidobacteria bacterium]|nr:transpeptidase family protein [Acidobacteriota bacterium]
MAKRSLILAGVLGVWIVAIIFRLYDLQVIQYVQLLARADRQQQRTVEIAPKRGTIYDRHMHPLAMSLAVNSVYAVPSEITDPGMVAGLLAPILNLDAKDLEGRFKTYRSFCWVKRKITSQQSARVRALNLKGIYFQKETKRFYPDGELAAQVLGFVGMDDNGLGGVEYELNKQIKGRPGKILLTTDARRHSFRSTEWRGEPGENVELTLDEDIQYIAEKALAKTVTKFHAAGGTIIVQDPHTGEILAMANQPTFDPNHYEKYPAVNRMNRAISWNYEPGSTFKLVTVSAALNEHLAQPNDVINCQEGQIVLAGHVIHDHERFGDLTVAQILAHSSDVGAIKLGLRLGEDRFYRYIRRFGFGSRLNLDLPGEEVGLVRPPDRWSGIAIGEISMGQGIGVTPLQMVSAYSAIANGGVVLQPRIVREVFRGHDDDIIPPSVGRRVVSRETAALMRQMLAGVVLDGTGRSAQLNGYSAAGKTGTAQKIDAAGRYSHRQYVASFIGFAPVENPAITVLVVIDTPVGEIYGAEVAGPAFKSIAEQTLRYLNVPQDNPSRSPQVISRSLAKSSQKERDKGESLPVDSELTGPSTRPIEPVSFSGWANAASKGTVLLDDGPMVTVPDFTGLSARRVSEQCQSLGLEMDMSGSGLAVEQDPSSGTRVRAGSSVRVRFAR